MFRKAGGKDADAMPSVYQRTLGAEFATLDPLLQRYFGPIPDGWVGSGEGRYDVAGSRVRFARPIFAALARRDVLFPERAHDVPFTIENRPAGDDLVAERRFYFADVTRTMCDRMTARGGRIVERVGTRGELEVTLEARVVGGGMRLASTSLAWHVHGMRVPLPRFARVTVSESARGESQRVDVRVRMPLLGEVFRFRGRFVYGIRPDRDRVAARP